MEQSSVFLLRLESFLGSVTSKDKKLGVVIGDTIHPRERVGRSTSGRKEQKWK